MFVYSTLRITKNTLLTKDSLNVLFLHRPVFAPKLQAVFQWQPFYCYINMILLYRHAHKPGKSRDLFVGNVLSDTQKGAPISLTSEHVGLAMIENRLPTY